MVHRRDPWAGPDPNPVSPDPISRAARCDREQFLFPRRRRVRARGLQARAGRVPDPHLFRVCPKGRVAESLSEYFVGILCRNPLSESFVGKLCRKTLSENFVETGHFQRNFDKVFRQRSTTKLGACIAPDRPENGELTPGQSVLLC